MMTAAVSVFSSLRDFSPISEGETDLGARERKRVSEAEATAYKRGYDAGLLDARADTERQIENMARDFAEQRRADEQSWHFQSGCQIADAFNAGIADLANAIEGRVAELLRPMLSDALHRAAMREFSDALDKAIMEGASVHVRGSLDLIRGIEQTIGSKTVVMSTVTSDAAASAEVQFNETTIIADFAAWRARLEERIYD